jgi:hypothetical protein
MLMTILTIRDTVLDIDANWVRIDVICGVVFAFLLILIVMEVKNNG